MKIIYDVAWHETVQKSFGTYKEAFAHVKQEYNTEGEYKDYWQNQYFAIIKRTHIKLFKYKITIQKTIKIVQPKNM